MSERHRALLALGGVAIPRVGDRGRYSAVFHLVDGKICEFTEDDLAVEVLRVSRTGRTIWTRMAHPSGRYHFGAQLFCWQRVENRRYVRAEGPFPARTFSTYLTLCSTNTPNLGDSDAKT